MSGRDEIERAIRGVVGYALAEDTRQRLEALFAERPALANLLLPDGWQLVPVEPTAKMLEMFQAGETDYLSTDEAAKDYGRALWSDMLAAAKQGEPNASHHPN